MSPLTEPTKLTLKKESVAATDTNIREVSLLLHGDGTNGSTTITDSSLNPKTVTAVGDAQISTAVADPFGNNTGVIAFDGTGDYLLVSGSEVTTAGDYTVETWARFNTENGAYLFDLRPSPSAPNGAYPALYVDSLGAFSLKYFFDGSIRILSNTLTSNTWYHVALCRYQGVTKLYVNGAVNGASYVNNATVTLIGATSPIIGSRSSLDVFQIDGYISNLRITKGVARYTSNFTPPTAPFPDF